MPITEIIIIQKFKKIKKTINISNVSKKKVKVKALLLIFRQKLRRSGINFVTRTAEILFNLKNHEKRVTFSKHGTNSCIPSNGLHDIAEKLLNWH